MDHQRDSSDAPRHSPAERLIRRSIEDEAQIGRPLSRRTTQTQRSIERYLQTGNRPRWMERVVEVDRGIAAEEQRLARVYRALREEHAGHPERFAERWRAVAASWTFPEELNDLIRTHNEWYPVERQLPMDLRTRDYVKVHGRSYRRPVLDAAWLLERFPPYPADRPAP